MDSTDEALTLRVADLSWREVEGEVVLLDERTWKYVHLNATASLLWLALVEGANGSELEAKLVEHYSVSTDRAAADVEAFVAELRERDYLES